MRNLLFFLLLLLPSYGVWSATYLGGIANDQARAVAVYGGAIYVAGMTRSSDFPVTFGPAFQGARDAWIARFDLDGLLVWCRYLGGPGDDFAIDAAADANGVVVCGQAGAGFPVTVGAFQTQYQGGNDGFIARLDGAGNLVWASYFGTPDANVANSVSIGNDNGIYLGSGRLSGSYPPAVAGAFLNAPLKPTTGTSGGRSVGADSVLAKIAGDGSRLLWARYVGGSANDGVTPSVRVLPDSDVWLVTETASADAWTSADAYDSSFNGATDVYLTHFEPDGTPAYATFLGGPGTDAPAVAGALALSSYGAAVLGVTGGAFPTTPGAWRNAWQITVPGTNLDGFVAVFALHGPLVASSYVWGSGEGIGFDARGNVGFAGSTDTNNYPHTSNAFQTSLGGVSDGTLTIMNLYLEGPWYATFFGGDDNTAGNERFRAMAFSGNDPIVAGVSDATNFPTWSAWQFNNAGALDATLGLLRRQ